VEDLDKNFGDIMTKEVFYSKLKMVEDDVIDMGDLCISALNKSTEAFLNYDKELADKLYKYIIENFVPPKIVRSGILTIYSLEKDGIKIIKDVLKKLKEFCEIKYKGAPEYYIKVVGLNVKEINNKLKNINKILEENKKIYYEIKWEK